MANLDSKYVIYTGVSLPYINVVSTDNDNLQVILGKINTAINASSAAPNYSGYNLYCITQTDGSTHPTNTQNFAEGISKIVCDNKDEYDTFVGTQYIADQLVLTTAIEGLQEPALTYVPFGITSADLIGTVYTKMFTGFNTFGFNTLTSTTDPYTASWGTLSITPSHSVITTWNNVITYLSTMASTVAGKQATLATYDNTANCLAGGATDSITTTMTAVISYLCDLPEFDVSSITFGGVTPGSDLETTVQEIIDSTNYLLTNAVVAVGTGLLLTSVSGTYDGKSIAIDPTYSGLFKVKVSSDDTTGNYVENKIVAGTGISVTTLSPGGNETFQITNSLPATGKVFVNEDDPTENYLVEKIPNAYNAEWGIGVAPTVSTDDTQLLITPFLNPDVAFAAMMAYISNTPALFSQFQALVNQTDGGACTAPTSLSVVINVADFDLTWTASGTADSQNVKYREKGSVNWLLTPNIDAANPQTDSATTATVENLNVNTIYEFAVDSVCAGGGLGTSNVYEMVLYDCATLVDEVTSQVISVTQNPLATIDTIDYRLVNAGLVVIQSATVSAQEPSHTFTAVSAGTYTVDWRYNATVNGVTLSSDDVSQLGAWCSSGSIVVS